MAGKVLARGVLVAGKLFFCTYFRFFRFCERTGASEFFLRRFNKMFRNKCAECGTTRSKSRFVGLEDGNILCRVCYHKTKRAASSNDAESVSTVGGKLTSFNSNMTLYFLKFIFSLHVFVNR